MGVLELSTVVVVVREAEVMVVRSEQLGTVDLLDISPCIGTCSLCFSYF